MNTSETNHTTHMLYPIWNNASHGPAIPTTDILDEDQQPQVWIFFCEDEDLASKAEAAGWPEVAQYLRGK